MKVVLFVLKYRQVDPLTNSIPLGRMIICEWIVNSLIRPTIFDLKLKKKNREVEPTI